jgi:3-(3-hydroxy-phenyl)propionate hydroxylase
MTPKSAISKIFRNAVLELARDHPFARPMVNSGRLSVPCVYDGMSLNGVDDLNGPAHTRPGAPCVDAPLDDGFLLDRLEGQFTVMAIDTPMPVLEAADCIAIETLELTTSKHDPSGALRTRYLGGAQSGIYLIRPDQHVAARWPTASGADIEAAMRIAFGQGQP